MAQLFERFRDRTKPLDEDEAFARFFEDTHLNAFRYVMALTGGNENRAEDITADAYLRAWKNRRKFTGSMEAAFGWLLTIARNVLIDQYRSESSRPIEANLSGDLLDDDPGVESILVNREMTQQVISALQLLPQDRREMVVLRYVLGWRVNQVAEHLGLPENTVSVMLRRSLSRLQELLISQGVKNERTA